MIIRSVLAPRFIMGKSFAEYLVHELPYFVAFCTCPTMHCRYYYLSFTSLRTTGHQTLHFAIYL